MDLQALIETTVTGMGYELVDVEMSPRARLLRIFIDRPEASTGRGISVEDCAAVSHQLSRLFDVENVDYDRLEVSSPGLDRVLKKAADFARFAGAEVQVKLRTPISGRRNFNGVLLGIEEETVRLQVDAVEVSFQLSAVDRARLVPKFG
jgi:ribosome maturation factor RimP